jgi:hypothetical protein
MGHEETADTKSRHSDQYEASSEEASQNDNTRMISAGCGRG